MDREACSVLTNAEACSKEKRSVLLKIVGIQKPLRCPTNPTQGPAGSASARREQGRTKLRRRMDEDGRVTAAQPSGAFHTLPTERTFGILDVMITTCWHAKITTTTTTLPVSQNHNHSQSLLLPASLIPWSSSRNATADECQSLPAATTHCSCQVSSHLNQIHLQRTAH